MAKKSDKLKTVQYILKVELVFYLIRLIVLKGGYAVGFGGVPNPIVVVYDALGIIIRIILIQKTSGHTIKFAPILFFSIATVFIKNAYYPIPPYYYYQQNRDISNGRKIQEKIIGQYSGQLFDYDTKELISNNISVEFKKDSLIIKNNSSNIPEAYYYLLESTSFGYFRNEEQNGSLYLDKFNHNIMEFSMERKYGELIKFKLRSTSNER